MRPMRRGFRPVLPGLQGAAAWLAVALVVGSVVFALTHEGVGGLLVLVPGAVLRGYLWQPLTYGFVESSAMGVIFGVKDKRVAKLLDWTEKNGRCYLKQ